MFLHGRHGADGAAPSLGIAHLPPGTTAAKGLAAIPSLACFYTGATARTEPRPPAHLPPGTTAAKGLAAIPDGGITFYPCYPAYFQDICEK